MYTYINQAIDSLINDAKQKEYQLAMSSVKAEIV